MKLHEKVERLLEIAKDFQDIITECGSDDPYVVDLKETSKIYGSEILYWIIFCSRYYDDFDSNLINVKTCEKFWDKDISFLPMSKHLIMDLTPFSLRNEYYPIDLSYLNIFFKHYGI